MTLIGYHASHEQFAPSHLLRLAQMAEQAGFDCIHSSDHFQPWGIRQGESGFSFSWLGAALQATTLPVSVVCTPGYRYHPAIVAQAISTLAEMFPGRFHAELGSGEAINEMITATEWPPKEERNERLLQCARIIRNLLHGQAVSLQGEVKTPPIRLYTLPQQPPPVFCAAISEKTAAWAGTWADGLLTTADAVAVTKRKMEVFHEQAGVAKPVYIQLGFSYSRSKKEALEGAWEQWKTNMLPAEQLANLATPQQFEAATKHITVQDVAEKITIFTDIRALHEFVEGYKRLGVHRIFLHNINTQQEQFIEDYGQFI
ncbi:TIGR03885 family FMN-dependent LLM class oxidoreductase [Niastella caeni]|uniref:TIGR03885 family FMN-dependent LLM class oxidoreductase n=1 Tax=Niastella caeni TaxID=2569763 RepID=A0A4S8HVC9_9BACT|nr:TIGR03885 family FMN-dependent LLM class oxidoreductase [Niastella caeni]THU39577.1 TIGR03885 family FMN-dependent LLM class oxidoreductase [Niastella caeni]